MSKTICAINAKGGVAKTTIIVNLAGALAKLEKKVLVVDLDPQGNTTENLGCQDVKADITDLLLKGKKFAQVMVDRGDMHVIPAIHQRSINLETELTVTSLGEIKLLKAIKDRSDDYDYILIDCPPGLGKITRNAVYAANYYIIPMMAEPFSLAGRNFIIKFANEALEFNDDLKALGFVFSKYNEDLRNNLKHFVVRTVNKDDFPTFNTFIREDTKLQSCIPFGQHIFEFTENDSKLKSTNAVEDYLDLAKEVIQKTK
ncbi:MAG: ParA family protein [Bacteroidota bacterium]